MTQSTAETVQRPFTEEQVKGTATPLGIWETQRQPAFAHEWVSIHQNALPPLRDDNIPQRGELLPGNAPLGMDTIMPNAIWRPTARK